MTDEPEEGRRTQRRTDSFGATTGGPGDDARIHGRARAGRGERHGVHGETDAADGFGLYTPDDAAVDGELDADAVRTAFLHSETMPYDAVVFETGPESGSGRTAYAVDADGIIDSGSDTAAVAQSALDAHIYGVVAQASDLTIDEQIVVLNQVWDGRYNRIDSTVAVGDQLSGADAGERHDGFAIYHRGDLGRSDDAETLPDVDPGYTGGDNVRYVANGLRNVRLFCQSDRGRGVYTEDAIHATNRSVSIQFPEIGWRITDRDLWTEGSLWEDIHVRQTTDVAMQVGSASFGCTFDHLKLNCVDSVDGTVTLELTDELVANDAVLPETNVVEDCQFRSVQLWPQGTGGPSTGTVGVRIDTTVRGVVFDNVKQHAGRGVTSLEVTAEAAGNAVFRDAVFRDDAYVDPDADFSVEMDPQEIIDPSVGLIDDFANGYPDDLRQSARSYDESLGRIVQFRPSWNRGTPAETGREDGEPVVVLPAGASPGLQMGAAVQTDTAQRWSLRFRLRSTPSDNGPLILVVYRPVEDTDFAATVKSGQVGLQHYGEDPTQPKSKQTATVADYGTDAHVVTVERAAGGDWTLSLDGSQQVTMTDAFVPSSPTRMVVGNRFDDTDVELQEFRYQAGRAD